MTLPANVARRVRRHGECVDWTGARNSKGYGAISVDAKVVLVHRYVYEQGVGPIPEGMTIDHLCRNRLCVNVSHMEVVTRAKNSSRALSDRRRERAIRAGWKPGAPTKAESSTVYADALAAFK